jgi:two-component system chemotaxis response regulator CheY
MLFAELAPFVGKRRKPQETTVCRPTGRSNFRRMHKILIVDDSATIRKMVRASLRGLGDVEFVEAGNGLEAIEQIALGPVGLIILDLNMPDMHGVDVLKFVRRHHGFEDVPVVVLTTRGDDTSRETALAAGATEYLTKPFTPQVLLSAARELLSDVAPHRASGSGS